MFSEPSGAASLLGSSNSTIGGGTSSLFKAASEASASSTKETNASAGNAPSPPKSLFGGASTGFGVKTAEGKPAGAGSLFGKSVGASGAVGEASSIFGSGGTSLFGGASGQGQGETGKVSPFVNSAAPPRFGGTDPVGIGTPDRPTFGSSSGPPTGGFKTSLFGSGGAASGNNGNAQEAQQSPQPSKVSGNLFGSAAGVNPSPSLGPVMTSPDPPLVAPTSAHSASKKKKCIAHSVFLVISCTALN